MIKQYEQRAEIKDPFMTLAQIAEVMGVSREMVRQIERSALMKARKVLRKRGIELEDFVSTLRYNKPIRHEPDAPDSAYELMYEKEEHND